MTKEEALKQGPDYERGFVDGAQHQMKSSVDKAVNRMAQPVHKHDAAIKTLEHLKYTYHGGEYWKPPLGKVKVLAQPAQEPVATVIEELEHDGQGWCSKVRWLYNPVPVGETLSWEQPK